MTLNKYILLLLLVVSLQAQDFIFEGLSNSTSLDFISPTVQLLYPNGEDDIDNNSYHTFEWFAEDEHDIMNESVIFFISTDIYQNYNLLSDGYSNTGSAQVYIPDINSSFSKIKQETNIVYF